MRPQSGSEVTKLPVTEVDQTLSDASAYPDASLWPNGSSGSHDGVFVFPASLEQIRYWTLHQLDGASTASNMAIAARLEGKVDDDIVGRAVQAIVVRHEALRTTFRIVDGQLCQVISESAPYDFLVTDLRDLPEADRAQAAEDTIEDHSHARADLATGPAFFVRLVHLTDNLHFLAFTMHHIVCDGWSNGILIRDFTEFYAAFSANREPNLPELPFQFADFTVWQQEWLESEAAQSALAYWRTHIRRDMPAVDLPTDGPRLPQKSYPGHIESTLLPAALTARLKAYCRAHDATMHQVLLAAFEAMIARYAGQNEFLLGSTIANRTQPGMENVVGRFANPQVILSDVTGDPTYRELLGRVIEWSTGSYAHQDLPFSRLVEEFQLDQSGATSQFLQVYFVYQKAFMQPQEAPGLKVVPRPSVSGGVNFDLLVSIVERAEGPRLQMEYNTVLFRRERILNLIQMYVHVLEAVMDDDTITVSRFPMLAQPQEDAASPSDVSSQTAAQTASTPRSTQESASSLAVSLAEWLDQQANAQGDTPAIIIGDKRHSWKNLRERSRILAAALLDRGISTGQTVAFRLESSLDDVATAWAALRIGAIALPLPSSATAVEWTRLLATHQPALALASAAFTASVPNITSYEEVLRDAPAGAWEFEYQYPAPDNTAWLGVVATEDGQLSLIPSTHSATLRQLLAVARTLGMQNGDTALILPADSATDAWVDLLLPLVAGCTLLYLGNLVPEKPQAFLDRHQVSFLFASPSLMLRMVQDRWAGDRRLTVVARGGLLSAAQVHRLISTPFRLWTLVSSPLTSGPIAISKVSSEMHPQFSPVGSQHLAILDDAGQPLPAGVLGELTLIDNEKAIRTGLLARTPLNAAGIEILDSVNRAVRLRGHRLRLGEVEEILWQSPSVVETFAAILPVDGARTLAIYFHTVPATAASALAVRERFQKVAPGHLSSAELISVDSIPRRPDGSVDFALLPSPGQSTPAESLADEFVPPRDELEKKLVTIWEEVLGIRPIGIRTQFFKLGGYSLMIVRLFARINKVLGTSLPITTIFNAPTVEQLADIVRGRTYYSSLVPVHTEGTQAPFFMIHSYLLYQGIPKVLGDDYPFYGLRELDTDSDKMTVEQRAKAYLDAIRSVQPHGPYCIGGWCAAGPLAIETARQIVASGESVGFVVLFDSWRPGYAAELAREQAGTAEMTLRARLSRKYRFHRNLLTPLSPGQRVRYLAAAIGSKFASIRDHVYLKNWAVAEWFCHKFGLSLPHFMHNVSLTTLNSLKEYVGVEPYPGSITLIRAKEAPYIPGAKEHCGWDAIVNGGIKVLWAPGNHESMFLDPHLQTVGELLRQSLAEAYAHQHPEQRISTASAR